MGDEPSTGQKEGQEHAKTRTLSAIVAIAVAMGGSWLLVGTFQPGSEIAAARPRPQASPLHGESSADLIAGDIPIPPEGYGFLPRNYGILLGGAVNAFMLIGEEPGDPLKLRYRGLELLDWYRSEMPAYGWTLEREYPPTLHSEEDYGDPPNIYAAAQDWAQDGQWVKISVANWTQFYEWGFRLTWTVYGSNDVPLPRTAEWTPSPA